jgi:hypothetical protein
MSCNCSGKVDEKTEVEKKKESLESAVERISRKLLEIEQKFAAKQKQDNNNNLSFYDRK